jgi:ribosomal protein S17E
MSKLLPMLDPSDEIRKLYFSTTRETIDRDLTRALDLLTRMPSDELRQRVAGYVHGLSELKREWKKPKKKKKAAPTKAP